MAQIPVLLVQVISPPAQRLLFSGPDSRGYLLTYLWLFKLVSETNFAAPPPPHGEEADNAELQATGALYSGDGPPYFLDELIWRHHQIRQVGL